MAGPKQQVLQQLDAAKKRREAIELKRSGMSLDEIVATGLYASRGAVSNAIKAGMKMAREEMFAEAELYRAEQLGRLEALLHSCWDRALAGSYQHIAEARRIISDIGDLTGAKAPVRFEIGEGDVDRLLARLDALVSGGSGASADEIVEGEVLDDPDGAPEDGGLPRAISGPG